MQRFWLRAFLKAGKLSGKHLDFTQLIMFTLAKHTQKNGKRKLRQVRVLLYKVNKQMGNSLKKLKKGPASKGVAFPFDFSPLPALLASGGMSISDRTAPEIKVFGQSLGQGKGIKNHPKGGVVRGVIRGEFYPQLTFTVEIKTVDVISTERKMLCRILLYFLEDAMVCARFTSLPY